MVSSIGPSGLTIDSLTTLVASLTESMQAIYGADINVASNSPDGQMINIFCQNMEDLLELAQGIYNSFGFMQAYGTQLDQRLALLGLARKQGTNTTTPVLIVANQALTIYGLDQTDQTVFTLIDQTGNQWQLVATHAFGSSGSASLTFQAATIGPIGVSANTITQQVTTVRGVTSVNNPTTSGAVVGVSEETDTQFKVRAAQSFALAATGPADSVAAALLNTPDVIDAYVIENATSGTVDSTPPNTVWCIVNGGSDAEIAQAIYAKKGLGCGMRGSVSYTITRPNGSVFIAKWDVAIAQPLYIRFTVNAINPPQSFDTTFEANQLSAALVYKLGDSPNIGQVIAAMRSIQSNAYLTAIGLSSNGTDYFDVVAPTDGKYYFTVTAANITISL